jgi:hypothetical protein
LHDDAAAQCFFQGIFFVCSQSEDHRQEDVEKVAIIGRESFSQNLAINQISSYKSLILLYIFG